MSAAAQSTTDSPPAARRRSPRRPSARSRPAALPEPRVAPRRRTVTSLPFIMLIAGILGGGLLTLLLINNSLAAGSFEQARRKAEQVYLFEQEQALRQEVQRLSSPTLLRAAARKQGLVPAASTAYLDIESGRILGVPLPAGGAAAIDPTQAGIVGATPDGLADTGLPVDAAPADQATAGDAAAPQAGTPGIPSGDAPAAEPESGAAASDAGDAAAVGVPPARTDSAPRTAYDRAVASGGVDR